MSARHGDLRAISRTRAQALLGVPGYVYHLLRRGVDTKRTDMADCSKLAPYRGAETDAAGPEPAEAALLEICVYPVLSERKMRKIAQAIREWATP